MTKREEKVFELPLTSMRESTAHRNEEMEDETECANQLRGVVQTVTKDRIMAEITIAFPVREAPLGHQNSIRQLATCYTERMS
jgi:hypothetical protein